MILPSLRSVLCSNKDALNKNIKNAITANQSSYPISTIAIRLPLSCEVLFRGGTQRPVVHGEMSPVRTSEKPTDRQTVYITVQVIDPTCAPAIAHRSRDFSLFQTAKAGAFVCSSTSQWVCIGAIVGYFGRISVSTR